MLIETIYMDLFNPESKDRTIVANGKTYIVPPNVKYVALGNDGEYYGQVMKTNEWVKLEVVK